MARRDCPAPACEIRRFVQAALPASPSSPPCHPIKSYRPTSTRRAGRPPRSAYEKALRSEVIELPAEASAKPAGEGDAKAAGAGCGSQLLVGELSGRGVGVGSLRVA